MKSMSDHYSAVQLRTDRWNALQQATAALVREPSGRPAIASVKRIGELFEALEVIEPYWAFPGLAAFDAMRRQFEHKNYDDLNFSVRRATRALASGAYRRRTIPLDRDDSETEENEDEAMLSPEARALSKPYFEVLIVDGVSDHQARWMRSNMHDMRRTEDGFIYEAVVVPSLEDALIGILFNHNIQAVVVRPRAGRLSDHRQIR